jgi:hypothetical protein
MSNKWEYGEAWKRHPIQGMHVRFADGSEVREHNLFDPLPLFMRRADLLFVDPPWNRGNLNSFYTKAGRSDHRDSFEEFYERLWVCVDEISPRTCYIEMGKEYLGEFLVEMKRRFKAVTFFNSTYYHGKDKLCYVIRGASKRRKLPLDGMDEEEIISWICANENFGCIGDLCMGMGLVGLYAYENGKNFVGTELNHKRLAVLVEKLNVNGLSYEVENL